MLFFILLTLVRLWLQLKKQQQVGRSKIYLAAALIGVLLVSYTGHLGGQMVHPDRKFQDRQFREDGGRRFPPDSQPSRQENNSTLNNQMNQKAIGNG